MSEQKILWTLQLLKDFKNISFQYRLKLKVPLIEVVDSTSFWGRWDPLYKKIEISEKLILEHSWDVVLGVLKHEMAHLIVSQIFKSDDSGHGESFQKACNQLGLEKEFRSASGDLPRAILPWKNEEASSPILSKVEKLFSLAQSCNQNEANLAMEKAQHLLKKYNLEQTGQQNKDYQHLIIHTEKKKLSGVISRIVSILINYYYVEIVFSDIYNAQKNQSYKTIEVLGRKENVAIAEYVYYFLQTTLEQLWNSHKSLTGATGQLKRSYQLGLLHGLEQKLEAIKDKPLTNNRTSEKSLILMANQELHQYLNFKFPRLSTKSSSRSRFDVNSFQSGQRDGQNIVINKGIQTQSNLKKFLTGRL